MVLSNQVVFSFSFLFCSKPMYVRLAPSDFRYFLHFFFHHHFFDFQLLNPLFILLFSDLNVRIWVIVIFHEPMGFLTRVYHTQLQGEREEREASNLAARSPGLVCFASVREPTLQLDLARSSAPSTVEGAGG